MKPIIFKPIIKHTIWGGNRIAQIKKINSNKELIGESWEICGLKNNETVALNQPYKDLNINELCIKYKDKLLGTENYKLFDGEFPLLIKIIDAHKDLSIQVHPNNKIAQKHGQKRGKTEMWYIMEAQENSIIYNGLKKQITPKQCIEMAENGTICDAISAHKTHKGYYFYIPAGRVHSIGAGNLIAEIQQTSDTTYRLYDFKRKDSNGNLRELHLKEATESIDFSDISTQTEYNTEEKYDCQTIVNSPYFTTTLHEITNKNHLDISHLDSFIAIINVDGEAEIIDNENNEITLHYGHSVLIPATTKHLTIKGNAKLLMSFNSSKT